MKQQRSKWTQPEMPHKPLLVWPSNWRWDVDSCSYFRQFCSTGSSQPVTLYLCGVDRRGGSASWRTCACIRAAWRRANTSTTHAWARKCEFRGSCVSTPTRWRWGQASARQRAIRGHSFPSVVSTFKHSRSMTGQNSRLPLLASAKCEDNNHIPCDSWVACFHPPRTKTRQWQRRVPFTIRHFGWTVLPVVL